MFRPTVLLLALFAAGSVQALDLKLDPSKTANVAKDGFDDQNFLTNTRKTDSALNIGLLAFDIGGLKMDAGFSATLWLYHHANPAQGATFELLLNGEDFEDGQSDWDLRPKTMPRAPASFQLGSGSGKWYAVNVTAHTKFAMQFGVEEFGLTLQRAEGQTPFAVFSATDYDMGFLGKGHAPYLELHNVTAAVPEPTTYALMGLGLALTGAAARRRRTV